MADEADDPASSHLARREQSRCMEIYLVTYIEPFRGTICRSWCGDEEAAHARVTKLRPALQNRLVEFEIERIEFPTDKAAVIDWLNANCYR